MIQRTQFHLSINKCGDVTCNDVIKFMIVMITYAETLMILTMKNNIPDHFPVLLNQSGNTSMTKWANYYAYKESLTKTLLFAANLGC